MAMAMYALVVTPLIRRLYEVEPDVKQIWFADDATAAGKLLALPHLIVIGLEIGYHPNAIKTHLAVKLKLLDEATKLFENTNVQITTQEQRHLGAAIGTSTFAEEYVAGKIEKWMAEISSLSKLALSQPLHGLVSRW